MLHGLSNRRITLRNLVATLELVDRDAPQQSELLSIPRRSHGGMDRPILGPRQESQLTQLFDWVGLVTEIERRHRADCRDAGRGHGTDSAAGTVWQARKTVALPRSPRRSRQFRRPDSSRCVRKAK